MTHSTLLRRAVFAASTVAALAFGAAQAVAAPAQSEGAARCTNGTCSSRCVSLGYAGGSCVGATCTCFSPA